MTVTTDPALGPLMGSWRLLSQTATFTDTGERVETFGPHPTGRMVLTPGGRIMFLIMRSDRQPPTNDADRAALFNNMISYTGIVRAGGLGQFITTVDVSLIPSEIGIEKLRLFVVDGDHLTIRLPEQISRFGQGRRSVSELIWERELSIHNPDLVPLLGSWRLLSVEAIFTDNGERAEPWGHDPDGRMVLDPTGRIMFLFTKRNRLLPTTEAERATLFNELLSYTGTVRSDEGGRFVTTVDAAKHPEDVGKEWLRQFTLCGDHLVVKVPEAVNSFSQGRVAYFDNVFEREHPSQ